MAKITLARALTELKMTEKRIDDFFETNKNYFVGWKKTNSTFLNETSTTVAEFEVASVKNMDSINGLIDFWMKLKSAISKANNEFVVTVNKEEMTISEAIFKKSQMAFKKRLLDKLRAEHQKFIQTNESVNNNILANAEGIAKQMAGNKVPSPEVIKGFQDAFAANFKIEFVDPIHVEQKIENLKTEIDTFTSEIDYILSEANAKYTIEVAD